MWEPQGERGLVERLRRGVRPPGLDSNSRSHWITSEKFPNLPVLQKNENNGADFRVLFLGIN